MNPLSRLVFLLSLGTALAASAQTSTTPAPMGPPRGGPGGPGRLGGHPIVRVLDGDHDGEISAAELANASAAIRTLDANGDGTVSVAELRARPANAPTPPANATTPPASRPSPPAGATPPNGAPPAGRPHPVDPVMLALDADGDGALSNAEISNAARSLGALDANQDGKLTRDELMPLPPAP